MDNPSFIGSNGGVTLNDRPGATGWKMVPHRTITQECGSSETRVTQQIRKWTTRMIELHYAPTPNGHKIAIALEELALPYEVHRVDIGQGDQFKPEFLAFSPNNRIPAIIDHDGP